MSRTNSRIKMIRYSSVRLLEEVDVSLSTETAIEAVSSVLKMEEEV